MIESVAQSSAKEERPGDLIGVYMLTSEEEQELVCCTDGSNVPVVRCLSELRVDVAPRVNVSQHSGGGVVVCLGGALEIQIPDSAARLLADGLRCIYT